MRALRRFRSFRLRHGRAYQYREWTRTLSSRHISVVGKMIRISSSQSAARVPAVTVHNNVDGCIKSWCIRGMFVGALFGFAIGAVFVTYPLDTDMLTFGIIGTLAVCAIECAVIAGAFGAFAAALYGGNSVPANIAGLVSQRAAGRVLESQNWREEGALLSAWPDRWAYPTPLAAHPILPGAAEHMTIAE